MGKIIGIDLGTTNSCIAIMEGTESVVVQNEEGQRTTPSVVSFIKKDTNMERLVGQPAKNQMVTNPDNTIYSVKRFMGREYSEVQEEMRMVPYTVEKDAGGGVSISCNDKKYSPPEISAAILQKMKKVAEDYLGIEVTEAVITVPAYFNDSQRQATKDAGRIAGLEVKRIVNEPTAAALAYGMDKRNSEEKVAVYDLGGGTFDISILELGDGVFEVKSTNGDTHLGGDDFDERIIEWLVKEFKGQYAIDLSQDRMALQRLKEAAEKAKREVSTAQSTDINLPFITADASGPKHIQQTLTRAKFEQMIEDLAAKTRIPCEQALKDSGFKAEEINEVILVGGSSRIPLIQKTVEEIFKKQPHKGVNPDEVVAMGAAIQGGILSGDVKDILLLDVTPLSLGIETLGGVFTKLIEKNTTIPTKKTQIFSTAADNQTAVSINVLQGEREMASSNRTLGRFDLVGIPPAPRGVPQVEVSFDIDANGIVHVSAKDLGTGKEQKIRIESSSGLSEEEIQKMVKDAESNADLDKQQRERVEVKNQAEHALYTSEKALKEYGEKSKINPEEKSKIEAATTDLKKAIESNNTEDMKQKMQALESIVQEVMQKVYQENAQNNAQGNASSQENAEAGSKDEGKDSQKSSSSVKDADYEVVDDKK